MENLILFYGTESQIEVTSTGYLELITFVILKTIEKKDLTDFSL